MVAKSRTSFDYIASKHTIYIHIKIFNAVCEQSIVSNKYLHVVNTLSLDIHSTTVTFSFHGLYGVISILLYP